MKEFWLSLALALYSPQQPPPVGAVTIDDTVRALSAVISAEYFDVAATERISSTLEHNLAAGYFASVKTVDELSTRLNEILYSATRDKHLRVQPVNPQPNRASANTTAGRRDQPTTAGFKRVDILPDNIGVLEMTMFLRPLEHRDALAAAMKQLQPADALIIDMRANGGGSPGTVALLMSYLFDEPELPLFDIVPRNGDPDSYRTEPASSGLIRNGHRPIFVLTSARSFSGGEGFAYLMQERKRAVIVGERTAGAANPGASYPVNDLFQVTVPNGRISSAIKRTNWEGDGVTPDILVPAGEALDVATERARATLKRAPKAQVQAPRTFGRDGDARLDILTAKWTKEHD